jgi:hypothetical protein
MEEEGVTLRRAAERLQVCHSLFVRWHRQQAADVNDPILAMLKSKRKATCAGPLGQLKPLKNALLQYVVEQREQGIIVSTLALIMKASSLSPYSAGSTLLQEKVLSSDSYMRIHLSIIWARTYISDLGGWITSPGNGL